MKNFEVKLMKTWNWGILGLGTIAQEFAAAMNRLHPVYAVASRDREKAEQFRQQYGATVSYGSYEKLLSDPAVDIVYIATVNSQHYRNIMDCLRHGKHVLCEKAIWGNYRELEEAYALAREQGLIDKSDFSILDATAHALKFSGFQNMYMEDSFPPEFGVKARPELVCAPRLLLSPERRAMLDETAFTAEAAGELARAAGLKSR